MDGRGDGVRTSGKGTIEDGGAGGWAVSRTGSTQYGSSAVGSAISSDRSRSCVVCFRVWLRAQVGVG